jgi:hypothetical protein
MTDKRFTEIVRGIVGKLDKLGEPKKQEGEMEKEQELKLWKQALERYERTGCLINGLDEGITTRREQGTEYSWLWFL